MANIRNTVNGGGESANSPVKQLMARDLRQALREGQRGVAAARGPVAAKPRQEIMQKVGKTPAPVVVQDAPARGQPAPQSQSITQGRKPKAPKSPQSQSIAQRRS